LANEDVMQGSAMSSNITMALLAREVCTKKNLSCCGTKAFNLAAVVMACQDPTDFCCLQRMQREHMSGVQFFGSKRDVPVESVATSELLQCVILGFDNSGDMLLSYTTAPQGTFMMQVTFQFPVLLQLHGRSLCST
jgi:hypothetical protein